MTLRLPLAILCIFLVPAAAGAIDLANIDVKGGLNVEILRFPEWPAADEQGWGAFDVAADADGWCIVLGRGTFEGGEHYDRLAVLASTGEQAEAVINQPVPSSFAETGAFVSMHDGKCTAHWLEPHPPDDPTELALMEMSAGGAGAYEMTRFRPAFNHRATFHAHPDGWAWYIAMANAPDPTNDWTDQAYQLIQVSRRDGGLAREESVVTLPARFIQPGQPGYGPGLEAVPLVLHGYGMPPEVQILRSEAPGTWVAQPRPWQAGTDGLSLDPANPDVLYRWQAGGFVDDGTDSWPDPGLYVSVGSGAEKALAIWPGGYGATGPLYANLGHDLATTDNGTMILMSYGRYDQESKNWSYPAVLLQVASNGTTEVLWQTHRLFQPRFAVAENEIWVADTDENGPLLFHLTPAPTEDQTPRAKGSAAPGATMVVLLAALAAFARARQH